MTKDEINQLKTDMYKVIFTGCAEIDSQLVGSVICSLSQEEHWIRDRVFRDVNRYLDGLLKGVHE